MLKKSLGFIAKNEKAANCKCKLDTCTVEIS